MLLMVGGEAVYESMAFQVLPPETRIKFTDAHKMDRGKPVYYFLFGDTVSMLYSSYNVTYCRCQSMRFSNLKL